MSLENYLKRDGLLRDQRNLVEMVDDYFGWRLGSATRLTEFLLYKTPFSEKIEGEKQWIESRAREMGLEISL